MLSAITPVTVLTAVAVFYGIAWLVMNLYNYYPVARAGVERVVTGEPNTEVSFVGTDSIDFSEAVTYPEIDVFVPAYDEADVIHQSIKSIRNTAYPQEKLSLTVLLEPDDDATIARVKELATEIELDLVVVPEEYPGSPNKPRALNYGFEQTDGDIVGIVDAENVVSENLFDRVSKAIVAEQCDYVQGMVDMVNEEDGWKNLLFRAEYGYWYRFILPAFKRLGFPIPLSGTTCFFRRDILESISDKRTARKGDPWDPDDASWLSEHGLSGITPWDPTNVTEDFELGLQLWCTDSRFGIIDSVTKEESPRTLENWLKQRTRWQKGKVFTFLDFFKHRAGESPRQRGHLLWQSFLPHAGPLNVTGLLLLIGVGSALGFVPSNAIVNAILWFGLIFLFVSVASFAVGYWLTSRKPPIHKLSRALFVAATAPAYWVLQWAADIRAFKQLAVGDLGWEKTVHERSGQLESLKQNPEETDSLASSVRAKATQHLWLWPILLLAFLLRLPRLNRSMWLDEVYSVTERGSMGFLEIITTIADPHPPLYYLALHTWMLLFGKSPLAARSLSLLFGIASIAGVYLLGYELYNRRTGLIAALLVSLSTFHIQYSQTARMYSMLFFFGVMSILFYTRCLRDHSLDNRFGYVFTTLCMLLTHPYGSFVLLGQMFHLSVWLVKTKDRQRVKRWLGTETLAVGPFVPWLGLVAFERYLIGSKAETRWLSTAGLEDLRNVAFAYIGIPVNYPTINITSFTAIIAQVSVISIFGVLLWQIYSEWQSDQDVRPALLSGILLVALVGVPFLISATVFPFFDIRYVIVGLAPIFLLVAKSISDIDASSIRVAALAVVLFSAVLMLPVFYGADHAEDWDEAASVVENEGDDTLVVMVPEFTKNATDYHLSSNSSVDTIRYNSDLESEDPISIYHPQSLENRIDSHDPDNLWAIVRTRGPGRDELQWSMPEGYEPVNNESIGRLELIEYDPTPTDGNATEVAP
ncbi:glycosyltransferase [Halonotius roseus]|nr:glycosyltransferase [Halonotius roseus]